MTAREKISVILPAYREFENLKLLIPAIVECLRHRDFEIVVIDDNSDDGTRDFLKNSTDRHLRPVLREDAQGLGSAILCGIQSSEGSILAIMDSDFNHDPAELEPMINQLGSADFISGSRFLRGSRSDYRLRTGLSRLFNYFVRILLRSRLTDHLFGFCVLRKSALENVHAPGIFHGGGDYYIRLLHSLERAGVRSAEHPAYHRRRHSGAGNRRFFMTAWVYFMSVVDLAFPGGFWSGYGRGNRL